MNYLTTRFDKELVEKRTLLYYDRYHIGSLLAPLLKNVPYRFLSTWIPYTSDEDVVIRSNKPETRCPYSLHEDYILLNPLWRNYLLENYVEIKSFIEKELQAYLKIKK